MINRLSKRFGLNIPLLMKESSWLVGGQFLRVLCGLIITIVLARSLDTDTFGLYKYILTLSAIFIVFTLPGLDIASIRLVAKKSQTSLSFLWAKISWGFLGSIVALGFALHALSFHRGLAIAIFAVAIIFPFQESLRLYESYLSGGRKFKALSVQSTLRSVFQLGAVLLAIFLNPSLLWITVAFFGSSGVYNFVAYTVTYSKLRSLGVLSEASDEDRKDTLRYGKRLTWLQLFSVVTYQFDKFLVIYLFTATDLAMYAIAIAFPDQIRGFLKNVSVIAMPRFSAMRSEDARNLFFKHLRKFLFFGTVTIVVYMLLAPLLFKILFPQYMGAVVLSQIAALTIIPIAPLVHTLLDSQKSVRLQLNLKIFAALIKIVFMLVLASFGLIGIVWALVLARSSTAIYSLLITRRV